MNIEIPPGFDRVVLGRTTLVIRSDYKDRLLPAVSPGLDAMARASGPETRAYRGRSCTLSIPVPGSGDERMVVRRAERGGLVRLILRDLHFGPNRPLRELEVSELARKAGVTSPAVLIAASERVLPGLYRGWVCTAEVRESQDLLSWLSSKPPAPNREDLQNKRAVIRAAADLIGAMHRAGLVHADLHLKNILLQDDGDTAPRLHLIDLDRSRIRARLSPADRMKNIERLDRYIEKWVRSEECITVRDRIRFLRRYFEDSRKEMRQGVRFLSRRRWRRRLHRIWWRLLGR